MKNIFKSFFILFLFSLSPQLLFAQGNDTSVQNVNKDIANKKNDSLNSAILAKFNEKVREAEMLRIADSIKKSDLESQIDALKNTEGLKKKELEDQLLELRNAEALRFAEKKKQVDSLRETATAYPVLGFFNDTLFNIYNRSGSFSARDRAEAINGRIKKLTDFLGFAGDSLQIIENGNALDLSYRDHILLTVSDEDALWNNTTKKELAQNYKAIISKSVQDYRQATSYQTLAKQFAIALLIIVVVFFLIKFISKFFRWNRKKIIDQKGKVIKGIRIKNYTLFDASSEVRFFLNANNFLKWIFILVIIYLALPILFSIFPWTKNYADVLFGYILTPVKKIINAFLDFLPNLFTILVILFVFKYIFRGIKYLKNEVENENLKIPGFFVDWANPTYQIIRVLIFAFMIIVIYPYLPGSGSRVFQGVSVFLGFLFTFGSAGSLSNIVSGLMLTYMRLFKIGDRVSIGDLTGDVIEKSSLVTRIRTIKNEIISIPNSTVMSSHTINYSSEAAGRGLIINTTVTIGYDVPWKKMHAALVEATLRTEYVLKSPEPFVLQTGLEDFYVSYQIFAYIREANMQATIYSLLFQNIQDVCNEQGIEIMSPHYRATRDGNETTIPQQHRSEDYKVPEFNVKVNNIKGE